VNIRALVKAIEAGRINASLPITEDVLRAAGLVGGQKVVGVRLLAMGEISQPLTITVSGASATAIAAIEAAGGTVTTTVAKTEAPAEA
jgi:large subunit ribosomal protein L15